MDPKGGWRVSPSYDLTFSFGPGGEHCPMVMGVGKDPGINQLLELAKISNIKKIDKVKSSVSKWFDFAKDPGISSASCKLIDKFIGKIIKENFEALFIYLLLVSWILLS